MLSKKPKAKKSEMLEVRVSFDTKEALRKKAFADGQSVSRIVRTLINDYLLKTDASSERTRFQERVHGLKSILISKPKSLFAAMVVSLATATLLSPIAAAKPIKLDLTGEFVKNTEDGGNHTKRIRYRIKAGSDENIAIDFDLDDKTYSIEMTVTEMMLENQKHGVELSLQLIETTNGKPFIIATPILRSAFDEDAIFQIDRGDGFQYNLKIRPEL